MDDERWYNISFIHIYPPPMSNREDEVTATSDRVIIRKRICMLTNPLERWAVTVSRLELD